MKVPLASLKMHNMDLSPEKFVLHHGHAPTDETTPLGDDRVDDGA